LTWLSQDRWLERCGPAGVALRSTYAPRRADSALHQALVEDPRRLVVVTGPAGAGVSRLVFEVVRRFPVVLYRSPIAVPDPVHEVDLLEYRLARVPAGDTPLVVLDGPCTREALTPLRELLARRIHPRLRVIVPCRIEVARRLGAMTRYPRRSTLVAELSKTRSDPPYLPPLGHDVVVLAAAGRVPVAALRAPAALLDAGVAAFAAGGEMVSLLDERNRGDILAERIFERGDGRGRLARAMAAHPGLRARVLESLLWFGDGSLASVVLPLTSLAADELPDVDALEARGVAISDEVLTALRTRGELALADASDETAALLGERLTAIARRQGDDRGAVDHASTALIRTASPRRRARLSGELGALTGDLEACQRASALARIHADAPTLIAALRREATLLRRHRLLRDARLRLAEIAALEDGVGHVGPGAATRLDGAALAIEAGETGAGVELAAAAAAASQAVGNLALQTRALGRLARLYASCGDVEAASSTLDGARVLYEAARDRDGIGDCHRALATLAQQRGATAVAAAHLRAALEAFAEAGRLPPATLLVQTQTPAPEIAAWPEPQSGAVVALSLAS